MEQARPVGLGLSFFGGLWAVAPPMAPPKEENQAKQPNQLKRERNGMSQLERPSSFFDWKEKEEKKWTDEWNGVAHQAAPQRGKPIQQLFFLSARWSAVKKEDNCWNGIAFFFSSSLRELLFFLHPSNKAVAAFVWLDWRREVKFDLAVGYGPEAPLPRLNSIPWIK